MLELLVLFGLSGLERQLLVLAGSTLATMLISTSREPVSFFIISFVLMRTYSVHEQRAVMDIS